MQSAQIDRIPVAQLPSRYNISRTVLYERFAALKIEPERRGNKAYVDAQQLELLDGLHSHLASGGSTLDYVEISGLPEYDEGLQSTEQLTEVSKDVSLSLLVEALARHLSPVPPDPFANFRTLEEAASNQWLFSTSHLSLLLGLSRRTVGSQKLFSRYGFTFVKSGRNGTETAWEVKKG